MIDIVQLAPSPDSPAAREAAVQENVVTVLRELLARAEAGEIHGMVLAWINSEGDASCRWTDHRNTTGMVAAVTIAQHRYTRYAVEEVAEETTEPVTP